MARNEQLLITHATKRALSDFEFFAKHCVKIRTKEGHIKPFILNKEQLEVVRLIEAMRRAGMPVRLVILKARQIGMSTLIEIRLLWRILRGDGVYRGIVLAHEKEAARGIFGIMRFAVDNLPQWFKDATGFEERYHTKYELAFGHTGSSVAVSSADSRQPGRSGTIQLVHLSEAAFYPNPQELIAALFAAIPSTADTEVYVESTGNGPSGWFYDTFWRAYNGKNEYKAVFFPWYTHDEYRMKIPEGVEVYVPPEYEELYQKGEITLEQLYWRQYMIENFYNGDESLFRVEFPATPEEAFLSNTATLFDTMAVSTRIRELNKDDAPKPLVGFLVKEPSSELIRFQPAPRERLLVYRQPEEGHNYVIGVDCGSGAALDGDASVACVLDVATGEQVAVLYSTKLEPLQFAAEVELLGKWYNTAFIAPEVTDGHGLTVAAYLRDNGYYMLYQRRVYDRNNKQWTHQIGWRTDKRTKGLMIDNLRTAFLNGLVIINDIETLKEMQTFVRHDDGSLGAVAGAHDDRVMALAIANQVRQEVGAFIPVRDNANATAYPAAIEPAAEQNAILRRPSRDAVMQQQFVHSELGAYM